MENKEKSKQVSFGNLKKLSRILSGSEINSLVSNISKSKMALDTFCKNLKEHEANLKKAASTPKETKEDTSAPVIAKEPVVESKVVSQQNFEKKPFDSNKKPENRFANNNANNGNMKFNKVGQKDFRGKNDRPQNNKDGKPAEKKTFVPRDNNGYKPRVPKVEVETIVAKNERKG